MQPVAKAFLIGCGVIALIVIIGVVWVGWWLFSGPTSGVKVGNEMDQYALDYIAEHGLLEPDEEVLAYYDVTLAMDGTEAAIVTGDRVLYHKLGNTTSIPIREIEDIQHRYETLTGDIIEIQSDSGQMMKIEIAPLNAGETFKNVLMNRWQRVRDEGQGGDRALEESVAVEESGR